MPAVVLVHYHLLRGGVTRVIELASSQLKKAGIPHIILSGSSYEGQYDLPVQVVENLAYRDEAGELTAEQLKQELSEAAHNSLGKVPLIWHFHNHSIGKNAVLADVVSQLALAGERMVLQIHDFAEDGRASNYKHLSHKQRVYPKAPQIRYAFLNSRDCYLMQQAGLPERHTCIIPNGVEVSKKIPEPVSCPTKPLILYPVRGIRRKNLGELFMWAALTGDEADYAVTLPPENKKWAAVYNEWEDFQESTQLPIQLSVVGNTSPLPEAGKNYEDWLAHSTHIISTSVAEGFGLSFIEPIALGKPIFGRDLPDITCDFKSHGIQLPHLYDRLMIPIEWIGVEEFRHILSKELRHVLESYGKDMSGEQLESAYHSQLCDGMVDFGNLPEHWQRKMVLKVLDEGLARDVFIEQNGERQRAINWITRVLQQRRSEQDFSALEDYSCNANRERLCLLYDDLYASDVAPTEWLSPQSVLQRFLKPERFHFLRT